MKQEEHTSFQGSLLASFLQIWLKQGQSNESDYQLHSCKTWWQARVFRWLDNQKWPFRLRLCWCSPEEHRASRERLKHQSNRPLIKTCRQQQLGNCDRCQCGLETCSRISLKYIEIETIKMPTGFLQSNVEWKGLSVCFEEEPIRVVLTDFKSVLVPAIWIGS